MMKKRDEQRQQVNRLLQKSIGGAVSARLMDPWLEANLQALERLRKDMEDHHNDEKLRKADAGFLSISLGVGVLVLVPTIAMCRELAEIERQKHRRS
jgi:hypothetical protein